MLEKDVENGTHCMKTVEEYLAKGFDRKTAEYFASGRKKILGVVPNEDFTLTIHFDNGEDRIYNVASLIRQGTAFAPLADPERFLRAYVDPQNCIAWDIDPTIDSEKVWSNKLDLCPDACYIDSVPIGGPSHA